MISILDASYYIPENKLLIEDVGHSLNLSDAQIKVYKKIFKINVIPNARNMDIINFVMKPIEELLIKNKIEKKHIKYLIHTHTARVMAPFGKSIIQIIKNKLQINQANCFGITVSNCASTILSLEVLSKLLVKGDSQEVALVVSADVAFTPVLQIIPNTTILGDAAAAILVKKNFHENKLLATAINTVGQYAKGIWLTAQQQREFESQYIQLLVATIQEALAKAKVLVQELKLILPHNVNIASWLQVAKCLNIPANKIYLKNISQYSHCFGADIFINYVTACEEGLLEKNDYYLMVTVGLGATFAAAVFQR